MRHHFRVLLQWVPYTNVPLHPFPLRYPGCTTALSKHPLRMEHLRVLMWRWQDVLHRTIDQFTSAGLRIC